MNKINQIRHIGAASCLVHTVQISVYVFHCLNQNRRFLSNIDFKNKKFSIIYCLRIMGGVINAAGIFYHIPHPELV